MSQPKACPNGCTHTDAEHQAFDRGVIAGRLGEQVENNPYELPYLADAWLHGHSVGALDFQEGEESGG